MDAATQSGATGDRPAWHAMPAGEVEERLATDSRKGWTRTGHRPGWTGMAPTGCPRASGAGLPDASSRSSTTSSSTC
jgi:hypothetical protein